MLGEMDLKLERKEEIKSPIQKSTKPVYQPVCHCRKVTEEEIRDAIDAGASTLDDLKHLTGATMECGRCLPAIIEIMEEEGLPLRKDTCKSFIAWRD